MYILKKKGEDVFYIGSTVGLGDKIRWHRERFLDYELWGQVLVDPRMRTVIESRMIKQARATGWILVNRRMPTEYGPNNKIEDGSGLLLRAIRRGDFESARALVATAQENPDTYHPVDE